MMGVMCAVAAHADDYVLTDSVLTVSAKVRELPAYQFADREDIAEVRFEAGSRLEVIGDYAFLGCGNLRKIELPVSLMRLGEGSFRECSGLKEISLPVGIKTLPRYIFAWCESLEEVKIFGKDGEQKLPGKDGKPQLPYGTKGKRGGSEYGFTDIGAHAFAYCKALKGMDFPKNLTHIGSNAFSRCESLTSVSLPASIKELESYAFSDCISLKEAVMPANGNLLGELIFSGCENLEKITLNWCKPPKFDCDSYPFEPDDTSAYKRCRLLVPRGCEAAYRVAPGWRLFDTIESN